MLTVALGLTLMFGLWTAAVSEDVRASTDGADHAFECGYDVPPSGTYALGLYHALYYDCKLISLAMTPSAAKACVAADTERFVPLYGSCFGLNNVQDGGGVNHPDRYEGEILVAVVGDWRDYSWDAYYLQDDAKIYVERCINGPCFQSSPEFNGCVSNHLVTYCRENWEDAVSCTGDERIVRGVMRHYDWTGAVQDTPTMRTARLCR